MSEDKKTFYVKVMGEVQGPMSGAQVKQLALTGRLFPDSHVKKGADGSWVTADRIKGISFDNKPTDIARSKSTAPTPKEKKRKRDVARKNGGNSAKSILILGAFFSITSMATLLLYWTGFLASYATPRNQEWINSRGFVPTTIIVFIAGCIALGAGLVARQQESGDTNSTVGKLASLEFSKKNVFIGFGVFWMLLMAILVISGMMKG